MTRFADNVGRIRVVDIDREARSGSQVKMRCTRAFTTERFSLSRPNERVARIFSWSFGSVSIAFQSSSRLPMVVPIVAGGPYVSNRSWEVSM